MSQAEKGRVFEIDGPINMVMGLAGEALTVAELGAFFDEWKSR